MRKLVLLLALTTALVFAGAALAVRDVRRAAVLEPGRLAGSSWQSGWTRNSFNKATSGYETTVTFIDNVTYAWHATIRNRDTVTYTNWWSSQVKKAHCKAHTGYHWGGCHAS